MSSTNCYEYFKRLFRFIHITFFKPTDNFMSMWYAFKSVNPQISKSPKNHRHPHCWANVCVSGRICFSELVHYLSNGVSYGKGNKDGSQVAEDNELEWYARLALTFVRLFRKLASWKKNYGKYSTIKTDFFTMKCQLQAIKSHWQSVFFYLTMNIIYIIYVFLHFGK